jgi:hypothetical protein
MTIRFAGFDLLLEDPAGEVSRYVRRYLEYPNSIINPPARTIDPKSRVQRPRWPQAPKIRPNQLYWPAGATRWGQFIGLATADTKTTILNSLASKISSAMLQVFLPDSSNVPVSYSSSIDAPFNLQSPTGIAARMHLLPPIPVSTADDTVWLLPMVDARYWWQDVMFVSTATTWADLLTEIQAALNVTFTRDSTVDVDSKYATPDKCIFRNGIINAAAALDLYCWATNQRVVSQTAGGGYLLRSRVTASDLYGYQRDAQLDTPGSGEAAAGGDSPSNAHDGDVPTDIVFHFTNDSITSVLDVNQAGSSPKWAAGRTMDLKCTAKATGGNAATLESMADKWSDDWWQWSQCRFTWGWNGLLDWHFTGFEDYALFDLGRVGVGQYNARTFVKSLPPLSFGWDFVPLQLTGQSNNCGGATAGYTIRFEVISLDEESRTALCRITAVECGGNLSDMPGQDITPGEIEICDPSGCYFNEDSGTILGRQGWAKWMVPLTPSVCQPEPDYDGNFQCQWEVFSICCALVVCRES